MAEPASRKTDEILGEALDNGAEEEELRVIVTLENNTSRTPGQPAPPLTPGPKPLTRADYRRRAIAANDATHGAANTAAITSLQKIGLTVRGSGSAGALVINGTVPQLRRALSLDCIRTATLDRSLELVSPHGKRKVRRPRNG